MKKGLLMLFVITVACNLAWAKEEVVKPRKAEVDSNFDGTVDRVEYYDEKGGVIRVESDTNFNGVYDEWVYYKDGKVVKAEKDTNGDGKPDTWIEY